MPRKVTDYTNRWLELYDEASEHRAQWSELSQYQFPLSGKHLQGFSTSDTNNGVKKHGSIINSTPLDAIRTLGAGLQAGTTSPARQWFRLSLADKDLREFKPVKLWLDMVRDIMLSGYARSNFYNVTHKTFRELGVYGTSAYLQEEDFDTLLRFNHFTIGEFLIALDKSYRPDTLYRKFTLSARQLEQTFGFENLTDSTKAVLRNAGKSGRDKQIAVYHCIQPNGEFDPAGSDLPSNKPYESVYFEAGAPNDKFLRVSGYNSRPFVAPRWDVTGSDSYGGCPGMDVQGDAKMIQTLEEKKLRALDKEIDPTLNVDSDLKGKMISMLPGGVNFTDSAAGRKGAWAVHNVQMNLGNVSNEILNVEQRIKRGYYNDLFLAVIGQERAATAFEIARKWEEKLTMIGPTLESFQTEMHNPTIQRTFRIMSDMGLFPPPPPELEGQEIKIEHIGLLAQAQQMTGIQPIEQTLAFVANAASVYPGITKKLDEMQMVDQYAELVGAPPSIIRSDEEVAEMQQAEQQQMQAQQAMQMVQQGADTAKTLSEADTGDGNALQKYLEAQQ